MIRVCEALRLLQDTDSSTPGLKSCIMALRLELEMI